MTLYLWTTVIFVIVALALAIALRGAHASNRMLVEALEKATGSPLQHVVVTRGPETPMKVILEDGRIGDATFAEWGVHLECKHKTQLRMPIRRDDGNWGERVSMVDPGDELRIKLDMRVHADAAG